MTLYVTSLASGSSGNVLLVRTGDAALLVDCGLPLRTIEPALTRIGIHPAQLSAILLTHEHGDHVLSAGALARRYGVPIIANQPTLAAIEQDLAGVPFQELATGAATMIADFGVRSFPVPHDAAEPVGYTISAGGWCVGIATDLGHWNDTIVEGLTPADLVVIEANHDQEKLWRAPYVEVVKHRIYGPTGHLDNIAAGRLLARLGADGRRRSAWLAHLSREANTPQIAEQVVRGVLALAGVRCIGIAALPRRAPIHWSSDMHGEQLSLFD
ncbi:MBL fold metallo-hydrolase [Roseiflexus castenholzii]|jgi:phosphoribosyl 1,2-cyclic phosphodiesterase|uniref:Beta-lactamase domain protein n=1 Tax=Roseiflexus castenholzii (strain DSM 13941 / HLO8) TaxID=383372 RepID=A7NQK4_ROSCS|nr:MBL fold metallo-hydrolase [Roseiflexus castenholzii]ABU59850.1 beta-lactamase domain protein [Roseiflexus castenholzii DSM 13941]